MIEPWIEEHISPGDALNAEHYYKGQREQTHLWKLNFRKFLFVTSDTRKSKCFSIYGLVLSEVKC